MVREGRSGFWKRGHESDAMKQRQETPGTYHKMDAEETIWEEERRSGHREHKVSKQHSHGDRHHHRHRHGKGRENPASTDTSLELGDKREEEVYKDSLYSPAPLDSLDGRDGRSTRGDSVRGREGEASPGRFSPRPRRTTSWDAPNEVYAEGMYDHMGKRAEMDRRVNQEMERRTIEARIIQEQINRGEGRIIQDTVPRSGAAESGQLRGGAPQILPGPTKDSLTLATAMVRPGASGKYKQPPSVAQKPDKKIYNKLGMEELWPGLWEEFSKLLSDLSVKRTSKKREFLNLL